MTDADMIYKAIIDRIMEACVKAEKRKWNKAYALAFSVGLNADIKSVLKEIKRKWIKELAGK